MAKFITQLRDTMENNATQTKRSIKISANQPG